MLVGRYPVTRQRNIRYICVRRVDHGPRHIPRGRADRAGNIGHGRRARGRKQDRTGGQADQAHIIVGRGNADGADAGRQRLADDRMQIAPVGRAIQHRGADIGRIRITRAAAQRRVEQYRVGAVDPRSRAGAGVTALEGPGLGLSCGVKGRDPLVPDLGAGLIKEGVIRVYRYRIGRDFDRSRSARRRRRSRAPMCRAVSAIRCRCPAFRRS